MIEPNTELTYSSDKDSFFKKWIITLLEKISGRNELERKYAALKANPPKPELLWTQILIELEIGLDVKAPSVSKIPSEGPLVIIANHPYGVPDGVAMCYLASLFRKKYSILANSVLCTEDLIEPYVLPIDFEESKEAIKNNIESKNEALKRLARGEAIVIFPGGGVSTSKGFFGDVTDLPWKRFVIKLITQTGATVVPAYIEGQNSWLFQFVSQFSLNLRLGLFIRETVRMRGKNLKIHIGNPISAEMVMAKPSRQFALDWLREQLYSIKPAKKNSAL